MESLLTIVNNWNCKNGDVLCHKIQEINGEKILLIKISNNYKL